MKIITCLRVAAEMDIPRQYAVTCRQRYITGRLDAIDAALAELQPWFDSGGVNAAFVEPEVCDLLIEKCHLYLEAQYIKTQMNRKESITDDMISRARDYPVEQVVDFHKGKAVAWCHPDTNPSLSWDRKRNRAHCFPCGKGFDSIGVLMGRDGLTFIEAVKALQ